MILYDVYILLCHIDEKNIIGHLYNPYYIRIGKLTRRHPSSRCRFSFELTKILRIMQLFQWYHTIQSRYTYQSNTLKLFPFSTALTRSFSLQPLNNHMIIEYHTMIILDYLPL